MSDLFDLEAKLSVQMGNTEQQLSAAQKQVKALEDRLKALEGGHAKASHAATSHAGVLQHVLSHSLEDVTSKIKGATGEMGTFGSAVSVAAGEVESLSGPVGLVVGGIAALAVTASAAGVAVFELAESAAEWGNSIFKSQQKTGLSVETLQALKLAGHEVGMELETMTTGLVKFTNNLNLADAGNKKMADFFKSQGVDAFHNSDEALNQFMKHFAQLPTDQERVVAASKAFGARFGANLIEVFNQTGGNLDAFKDKLKDAGVLMSEEGVKSSHEFVVALHELEAQLESIQRILGTAVLPTMTTFFETMTEDLAGDKGDWKEWSDTLSSAVTYVEGEFLAFVHSVGIGVTQMEMFGHNLANGELMNALRDMLGLFHTAGAFVTGDRAAAERAELRERVHSADVASDFTSGLFKPKHGGAIGGGSGAGKKEEDPAVTERRLADIKLKIAVDEIKEEQSMNDSFLKYKILTFTQFYGAAEALERKHHMLVLEGLDAEKSAAEDIKKDSVRKIALATIEQKYAEERNRNLQAERKLHDEVIARTRERIVTIQRLILEHTRLRRAIGEKTRDRRIGQSPADQVIDLGGGSVFEAPDTGTDLHNTRDRHARQAVFDDALNKAHQLAGSLTNVISDALTTGFQQGMNAGLITFAMGILEIIKNTALKHLEQAIADAIMGGMQKGTQAGQKGGGGGLLGTIFGIVLGALGAGVSGAGAGGGIGGLTGGKYVPFMDSGGVVPGVDHGRDSQLTMLRPGELVIPKMGARNLMEGKAGTAVHQTVHNHYNNWNISTPNPRAFMGRDTQAQLARQANKSLTNSRVRSNG